MHRTGFLVTIALFSFSCQTTTTVGDPYGSSRFYLVNPSADSMKCRVYGRPDYATRLPDSIVPIGPHDTFSLGTYSSLSPPTPASCLDSVVVESPLVRAPVMLILSVDSIWQRIRTRSDYPQIDNWYFNVSVIDSLFV
jgi:hypothetical protein